MTDAPDTDSPENDKPETDSPEPSAVPCGARLTAFDPADPSSMEFAMHDMAFAARFLSQSFMDRVNLECLDEAGYRGLSVILECMADQLVAMEAAYAGRKRGRKDGDG